MTDAERMREIREHVANGTWGLYAYWEACRDLLSALDARERRIEELVKAIHRLPLPPQDIGDGPDERVGFILTLLGRLVEAFLAHQKALEPIFADARREGRKNE
mgnify:CR=1 FL=1